MLKNMRRMPSIASTMSPALVRSPTTTLAPISRSWSARSSLRRTKARTCSPLSSSDCTTRRLTLPMPPPAPVTRYMALVGHGPGRGGDQVAAFERVLPVLVYFAEILMGHHLDERRRRGILH